MTKNLCFRNLALLSLLAALILVAGPPEVWAQTNEVCYSCHSAAEIMQPHHALNLPSCYDCHDLSFEGGAINFLPPDCQQCHKFTGGPGAPIHDTHTDQIPSPIPDCEACHVGGAPGGPLREPFGECKTCHIGFQGGPSGTLHQAHTSIHGATDCTTCHGSNAPACVECHLVASTNPNFLDQMLHDFRNGAGDGHVNHNAFTNNNCESCHVSGVPGGPLHEPFGECKTCHTGFQGGPLGPLHLEHTTTYGATDCNTCHGDNAPACTQCHDIVSTDFPGQMLHDFRNGGGDGHINHNTFTNNNCEACHVSGVAGGPMREPFGICVNCHTGFMGGPASGQLHMEHTDTYGATNCNTCHGDNAPVCNECHDVVSTEHGVMAHDFRFGPGATGHDFHTDTQGVTNCEDCHVSGVIGGPLNEPYSECASCHTGFQNGQNGPLHLQHTSELGASDCKTCHGDNAPACSECHNVPSTNPDPNLFGKFVHDFRNGVGGGHNFHNDYTNNDCQRCHISGIPGGPLREPFGECAACHDGFQGGPSGPLHFQHTMNFGAADCTICHGDNAPACTQCHAVDRHDFRNGGGSGHIFHNPETSFNCQLCHISGVPGADPLPPQFADCSECHTGFQGGPSGELHMEHTNNYGASDCNTCHGVNAPGCTQCHPADPHHESFSSQNGDCARCHLVPASAQDRPKQAACRECHGAYQHDNGGPIRNYGSCAACHDTTPFHAAPPRGVGYNRAAPGKGHFALFWRKFTNNGQEQEDRPLERISPNGEDCDDEGGFYWSRPSLDFYLKRITHNGRYYDVPAFPDNSVGPPVPREFAPSSRCGSSRYSDGRSSTWGRDGDRYR